MGGTTPANFITMPFYEYECQACHRVTEQLQKLSDPPLTKCPSCGKDELVKLISASAFRLKGGGWYETDFKSDGESKRNLAGAEKEAAKADTTTEAKTESKPEKPAPAAAETPAPQKSTTAARAATPAARKPAAKAAAKPKPAAKAKPAKPKPKSAATAPKR
jgi:putative FmdB family regulatory protein